MVWSIGLGDDKLDGARIPADTFKRPLDLYRVSSEFGSFINIVAPLKSQPTERRPVVSISASMSHLAAAGSLLARETPRKPSVMKRRCLS